MKEALILFADGFEETEAVTLADILERGGVKATKVSISNKDIIKGAHNISILADITIDNAADNKADIVVLPGGMPGVTNLMNNQPTIELIKKFNSAGKWIAAICAAPMVLDKAGLLKGEYTCYPSCKNDISSGRFIDKPVVISGNIITSAGVGTAIEMGLKLIEILVSKEESTRLAKAILYKTN